MSELFLLRHRELPGLNQLKTYMANGGFDTWMQVVKMQNPPMWSKRSKIRGCAGAEVQDSPPVRNGPSCQTTSGPTTWWQMQMNRNREPSKTA